MENSDQKTKKSEAKKRDIYQILLQQHDAGVDTFL